MLCVIGVIVFVLSHKAFTPASPDYFTCIPFLCSTYQPLLPETALFSSLQGTSLFLCPVQASRPPSFNGAVNPFQALLKRVLSARSFLRNRQLYCHDRKLSPRLANIIKEQGFINISPKHIGNNKVENILCSFNRYLNHSIVFCCSIDLKTFYSKMLCLTDSFLSELSKNIKYYNGTVIID